VLQLCQMSKTLSIRIDADLAAWLEEASARTGVSQGKIVRDALEGVRASGQARPWMRLVGSVRGTRDLSSRKGFSRP